MSECIYQNESGDEWEEKTVVIYDSTDDNRGHDPASNTRGAVTWSGLHQQPAGPEPIPTDSSTRPHQTCIRAVTVCLGLLCLLLLAGIIGIKLHYTVELQTLDARWAESNKQHTSNVEKLYRFCKDGCKLFNGSFYYISPASTWKTWDESRQDCKDRGADLVIVNSEEEQDFISQEIKTTKDYYWIGLTNGEEGTWRWVDGSALNSTGFWKTGRPSGKYRGQTKDCVQTYIYADSWDDIRCDYMKLWICEIQIKY